MGSEIRLHNGRMIDPFNIEQYEFDAQDFIHPLALLNRYTGHTKKPYSVAEHTVRLANSPQVRKAKLCRAAVLHDFNEGLTNDLPHPFKQKLPEFVAFEERVQRHIFNCFDEPWENMEALKEFDRRICQDEMQQILLYPLDIGLEPLGVDVVGWGWETAKTMLAEVCKRWSVK